MKLIEKSRKKSYGPCHAKRPLKALAIVISKEAPICHTHMKLKELLGVGAEGAIQTYHSITDQLDQRAIVLFRLLPLLNIHKTSYMSVMVKRKKYKQTKLHHWSYITLLNLQHILTRVRPRQYFPIGMIYT